MNVIVVDTSSWISYLSGKVHRELDLALREGRVFLPPIVAAELLSGVRDKRERGKLIDFLQYLPFCQTDLDHWIRVGDLRRLLASKGVSVSTPDAHIAQCSLDLEGYLLTEDGIFGRVAKMTALSLLQ